MAAWHVLLAAPVLLLLAAAVLALCQWHRRVHVLYRQAGRLLREARVALAEAQALRTFVQVERDHFEQHHAPPDRWPDSARDG